MIHRVALSLALLLPITAFAQQPDHMPAIDHAAHMTGADAAVSGAGPTEPGQSAFAAIQEIVALLETDPSTDWSKVDIEALRQHLIDMNNVTMRSVVRNEAIDGGMRFSVSATGPARESIRRMVLAHAATMNGVAGWTFVAERQADGAILTVSPADTNDMAKLRALGFIGVMTRGMHHQTHHLMIAAGKPPHR